MGYTTAASVFIALLVLLLHPLSTPAHTPFPLKAETASVGNCIDGNALEVIRIP